MRRRSVHTRIDRWVARTDLEVGELVAVLPLAKEVFLQTKRITGHLGQSRNVLPIEVSMSDARGDGL